MVSRVFRIGLDWCGFGLAGVGVGMELADGSMGYYEGFRLGRSSGYVRPRMDSVEKVSEHHPFLLPFPMPLSTSVSIALEHELRC